MDTSSPVILITGASGFIGRNIVDHLRDKYVLLAPSHHELDLLSQEDVRRYFSNNDIDIVIHCANFGGTRKSLGSGAVLEKNLRMFYNIAENADAFSRLIQLGSGAEYGKNRNLKGIDESRFGEVIPLDEYGFSKYIISRYIEKTDNMCCMRLFGIFGKYEDYQFKFISNAIIKNLFHLPITIRQNVSFSWLYINDFLVVLDHFIDNSQQRTAYNITPSLKTDLISIAEMINSCSDFQSEICVENDGLNFEYSGNNQLLLKEMKDLAFTPMRSAVAELMEHYRTILPTIDRDVIEKDPYAAYCKLNFSKSREHKS